MLAPFRDLIHDRLPLLFILQLRVHFDVEKSLRLEVRCKRLPAFFHGFIINADPLINRQQ